MQNMESGLPGATSGNSFGHKEENRTFASRIKNTFNKVSDYVSNAWNGATQNLSDEWEKHAQMARKAKSALVRFLEGAMSEPPMCEDCT